LPLPVCSFPLPPYSQRVRDFAHRLWKCYFVRPRLTKGAGSATAGGTRYIT
jgi:hypothetical protein